ncbi:P-loop containing nucleoside triphosphate hydrolase protein [Mycena belliarum]|uniref:RNA helicase n=1 Tax=Mycena belliarum TaxID=1033014 RepID=A0AAD6XVN1_9AGAR|nr:P-loop containing nucleoside triphosphate hydrolase protein [Mycena belliae]
MNREKFNSKARQSTAGPSRKKGKNKSKSVQGSGTTPDPNAEILVPRTKEELEQQKKEKLRAELAAQSDSKWNSKKRKRLDQYIEKKLQKEERVVILEKLAQSQATLPSTVHLQSSATLGTGKAITHRDRLDKLEDKEIRRALDGRTGKRRRQDDSYAVTGPDGFTDDEEIDQAHTPSPASTAKAVSAPAAVGSALQRNPDGSVVTPKLAVRSRGKKAAFKSWKSWKDRRKPAPAAESDSSFDSSNSENDSPAEGEEGDSSGSDSDDEIVAQDENASPEVAPPKRGFKDWALQQLSIAKGYAPPTGFIAHDHPETPHLQSAPPRKKQKTSDSGRKQGPLGVELHLPNTAFAEHVLHSSSSSSLKSVNISRPPDVLESRILLPIISEEQPIMEAILLNPVVIICGETGSGKTTQVPQFLFEAGFGSTGSDNPGMIGITQPRRVAAMSMAARVAHELALPASRVSYQIRYDATVSPATSIKFMTDGVLLRELATDFMLTKYSVIIIDEAHERSMNTDILIGVLSRVLKLREEMWKAGTADIKPLRLVIMSATLRVSDFAENKTLFSTSPPVITVAARQHPVTVHFNRRTFSDYVTEAVKKTTKIHTRLPPGGILIFLTGQNEITGVCRKLEAKFSIKALERKRRQRESAMNPADEVENPKPDGGIQPAQADVEAEDLDLGNQQADDLAFDVDANMVDDDPEALDSDEDTEEQQLDKELGLDSGEVDAPMHIVPLYSLLPSEKQMLVFKAPPPGCRLVVVSTNVAETSLTIPGIRYVVDCGRAKERRYDIANGVQAFQVSWISKASAAQRAGRAGRTGPGHCYRLYSSALYEHHFDQFSKPEILRTPIEGVVLQMKSMHIDAVVNFPFPTPPDRATLYKAEKVLGHLGALGVASFVTKGLTAVNNPSVDGQITELGRLMSLFPLSPRFSRMLVSGQQQGCLPYIISIVSALSVGDPFLHDEAMHPEEEDGADPKLELKEAERSRRKAFFTTQHTHSALGNFTSDVFRILSVVGAYEFSGGGHKFCAEHFVRPKAMEEIHKLRAQISNIVQVNFATADAGFVPKLMPPTELQLKVLRQLLTAGFIDQVAVRKDRVEQTSSAGVRYATSKGVAYKAMGVSEDVYIHPSSVLANAAPPEYVVFSDLIRTSRVWIKGLTVINPAWLSSLAKGSLCTFSKPYKSVSGELMLTPRFGSDGWELPAVKADISKD